MRIRPQGVHKLKTNFVFEFLNEIIIHNIWLLGKVCQTIKAFKFSE